jgi:hypothetical protein
MKLDMLVRIEGFHLHAGAETRPGMDRDDTRGTYCALRGQRGNANVKAYGEFAAQNRARAAGTRG